MGLVLFLISAVQLQHHARHQLPTFQLIFVHVIESLVFVPVSTPDCCFTVDMYACLFIVLFYYLVVHMEDFLANNLLFRLQIMIGILFFLFEFYDDQLLAFMVLILVWLSELFTLIRSPSLSLTHTLTHTLYILWNDN